MHAESVNAGHVNKDMKTARQSCLKPDRVLEREQSRIRHALPDILAREASEIASKQHGNRGPALDDVHRRITRGEQTPFAQAFFECLFEWLSEHGHRDAALTVRSFIEEHLLPPARTG
jgi:hypothetical protein